MKIYNRKIKFIAVIFFISVIIFLNNRNYLNFFKNRFLYIFYYPELAVSKITFFVKDSLNFVFELKNAYDDKADLIDQNNKLQKQISDLKEIENENKSLRSILNLPLIKERTVLDSIVIGKDPYSFSEYLLLNRGSTMGIKEDMPVIDDNGFYIGKIINVSEEESGVLLVNDNRSATAAVDQNTRVQGLVKNDRNIGLFFDMVLQDAEINQGDIIVSAPSPASDSAYPIAKVISVEKYPNKTFQKIILYPLADIKNLEKAFIVIN